MKLTKPIMLVVAACGLIAAGSTAEAQNYNQPSSAPNYLNGSVQKLEALGLNSNDSALLRSVFSGVVNQLGSGQPMQGAINQLGSPMPGAISQLRIPRPMQGSANYFQNSPGTANFDAYAPSPLNGNAMQQQPHNHHHHHGTAQLNVAGKSHVWHNCPAGGYVDFTGNFQGQVHGNELYKYGGFFADGVTAVPKDPMQEDFRGWVEWKHLQSPEAAAANSHHH